MLPYVKIFVLMFIALLVHIHGGHHYLSLNASCTHSSWMASECDHQLHRM